MELTIVYRRVQDLTPDPNNTRTHSAAQVDQIAVSILTFGFTNPVLITPANQIVAGEGRWLGVQRANELVADPKSDYYGRPEIGGIPCVVLHGLTDQQRRAYVIADNRIAQNSGWDWAKLESELSDLVDGNFDVDVLAFTDSELEALLSDGGILPDNTTKPPKRKPSASKSPEVSKGVSKIMHTCPNCGEIFN